MKEKRFCKGCEDEVTERMWCHCGSFPLDEKNTYTEAELIAQDEAIEALEAIHLHPDEDYSRLRDADGCYYTGPG